MNMNTQPPTEPKMAYLTVVRNENGDVLFSYRLHSHRETLIKRIKRKGLSGDFTAEYYLDGVSVNKVHFSVPIYEV